MITILHGDNTTASRNMLHSIRAKFTGREIREVSSPAIDRAALTQALESESLFSAGYLVIIENLFAKLGKKSKSSAWVFDLIRNVPKTVDVILWEDRELTKSQLSALGPGAASQLFKIPPVIFQFLDAIRPGNPKEILALFTQCQNTHVPEVIFVLIVRRLRELIILKDGKSPGSMADWQRARLTNQAKLFTMDQLTIDYGKLIDMELSVKTGSSPFTLKELIEQFLITV